MLVNRHSTLFFLGIVLLGTLYAGFQSGWSPIILAGSAITIAAAYALVRYARRAATRDIPAVLRGGKPVLVEFYSEF